MTTEEKLDKLTDLVGSITTGLGSLSSTVALMAEKIGEHDEQIALLIELADKNTRDIEEGRKSSDKAWEENRKLHAETERLFQAYLTTIHPRQ